MSVRRVGFVCLVTVCGCLPAASTSSDSPSSDTVDSEAVESASEGAGSDWKQQYNTMIAELQLGEDEQQRLLSAFESREAEIGEWMQSNGTQLKRFERRMLESARSKDLSGVRTAKAKAEPLRNELRALVAKQEETILSVLSDENTVTWAAYELTIRLTDLMSDLSLTQDQIERIRVAAVKAVEKNADAKNPEAAGFLALERMVESQILTDDQVTAYESVKKKNPMRSLK